MSLFLYSGTELNRHSHYCEQDFKSCVSTSSTTRVNTSKTQKTEPLIEKKSRRVGIDFWAEDRARTGHPDLGKVVLYQMSYFRNNDKNSVYFSDGKNKRCDVTIKILFVSWVVQGIGWHFYLGRPLVPVRIQIIAPSQNKSQHQKYLAKPDKTWCWYPVVCKILMWIIYNFLIHFIIVCAAKIRGNG